MTRFSRGATVGGYRIEGPLGEGGMGIVYRAVQLSLGREVALKVLNPGIATDKDVRKRFLQEGVLAARVTHPRLVRALEVGEQGGRLFLAYELIDGPTLRTKLDEEGPLGLEETIEVMTACADVLQALHRASVLHRDLKPANIFVSPSRGPLIGDLGIAKDLVESQVRTQAGMMLGTPAYMAPEFLKGTPASAASDLYAAGVVLFECLAGRLPFYSEDPMELMRMQASAPLPDIGVLRPGIGPEWRVLIERLLHKDPAKRLRSAEELRQAIEELPAVNEGGDSKARRPGRNDTLRVSSSMLQAIQKPARASRPTQQVDSTRMTRAGKRPNARWKMAALAFVCVAFGAFALDRVRSMRPRAVESIAPVAAPTPEPAAQPAKRASTFDAAVLAAKKAIAACNEEAWKLQLGYTEHPERIEPRQVTQQMIAIARKMYGPAAAIVEMALAMPEPERQPALRACGAVLSELARTTNGCRSSLWGIFGRWDAHNTGAKGVVGMTATQTLREMDYKVQMGETAMKLARLIPKSERKKSNPVFLAGVACLVSCTLDHARRLNRQQEVHDEVQSSIAACFEPIALSENPGFEGLEVLAGMMNAMDNLGVKSEYREQLERTSAKLSALKSPRPGQLLVRHILDTVSIESSGSFEIIRGESDAKLLVRMPGYAATRDRLILSWPYDPRLPIPAQPTAPQLDAARFDNIVRTLLGNVRNSLSMVARPTGAKIPPEPNR